VSEGLNPGVTPAPGARDVLDRKIAPAVGQPMRGKLTFLALLALLALLSTLIQTDSLPYYPLHMGMEFLSLVLVVLVFAVVWQTPAAEVSCSHLVLAIALFASGWFAFVHANLINDMPNAEITLALAESEVMLLAGSFIVATSLLGVSFFPALGPATSAVRFGIFAGYTLVCLLASAAVFVYGDSLSGVSAADAAAMPLGRVWAWFMMGLLGLATWRFYQTAKRSNDKVSAMLFLAMATASLGELLISSAGEGMGESQMLGHAYWLLAYGLFYQALFSACVTRAYEKLSAQLLMRRQVDQTLRTQAMALNSTPTPIFVTDLHGALVWRNRASRALIEQNFSDVETRNSLFAAPITPDLDQGQEMREWLEAGSIWKDRIRMKNPHGKEIVLDRTVTPVRDDHGAPHGYVAVSEDVTDREYAEMRYKRVLDMSLDGFMILDTQGHLREVNDAYASLSGYTLAELQTMHISQLKAVADHAGRCQLS
jgi:PAS domain S-box-containing protein